MWENLPKDPLINLLEEAVAKNPQAIDRLIEAKTLPRPTVCCTRCDKADWHISERVLACYCKDMSVTTWESSTAMVGFFGTTLCSQVLKQALKKNAETEAADENASKRPERQEAQAARTQTH